MRATIEVAGLRKRFGQTMALDGMSFTMEPGQVTGFVGLNRAGKSTTMRVILGLIAAASTGRIALRTTAPSEAMAAPAHAGATVAATGRDTLTVTGLAGEHGRQWGVAPGRRGRHPEPRRVGPPSGRLQGVRRHVSAGCAYDWAKISLFGVQVGQAMVAILAVLAISGEYSTGMIRTTLTAMPRRATALIALLSLGIAAAVRDSATAIGVVLGLLYILSILPS
ncbi:ATP-binding cassette domain-containing protein [Nonomuraea sp. CA-143628]|uniref:ATP-binding cassette domain-containing protein n=1 Tax=Nonomuraea sp. CA-143628 TaxID=3239997 RepID=UPI003D8F04A6